ncbi:MAG: type II secretion system protein, partial [Candidatus Nealsonbacteria bacterium]|nr:type II secretion system protein [Candidatus Nealsonbacteria bacterium]
MFSEKEKGMTIAEMMAVLFIIAIILTVVLIGYRQNQQKIVLDSAALKLAADIRKQQSIAGLDDMNCVDSALHPSKYKYGYGIRIFKNIQGATFYYLFSDCDGDNNYSAGDILTRISFPSGVELESAVPSYGSPAAFNLVFYPPGPSVAINGSSTLYDEAKIVIRLKSYPL